MRQPRRKWFTEHDGGQPPKSPCPSTHWGALSPIITHLYLAHHFDLPRPKQGAPAHLNAGSGSILFRFVVLKASRQLQG